MFFFCGLVMRCYSLSWPNASKVKGVVVTFIKSKVLTLSIFWVAIRITWFLRLFT